VTTKKIKEPKVRNINLLKIFDELNLKHFSGMVCGGIGWKNIWIGDVDKGVVLAECLFEERYIRVNTILQDRRIPLWFVKYVIFHEMLHIYLGPQQFSSDGFSFPHNERFQILEGRYPDYQKSLDFENKKIHKIACDWKEWRDFKRSQKKKIP
jgi:hypothetical protein